MEKLFMEKTIYERRHTKNNLWKKTFMETMIYQKMIYGRRHTKNDLWNKWLWKQ